MNLWQNFVRPTTIHDALLALRDAPPPTAPIAGGTDLLLDLDQSRHPPTTTLVDLTSVPEMGRIEVRAGDLFVGAAVPLAQIAGHPDVLRNAVALVEACDLIGGPQVRNVATLGGNVAHGLPAADGTIALLALDAKAELASLAGTRHVPLVDLFEGPGKTILNDRHELLVGFHLPMVADQEASAFRRIMRPQGVALPILNLAVWIRRRAEVVDAIRLAVGPSGPTPRREPELEAALIGGPITAETCEAALQALLLHAKFRNSARRASSEYRRDLVGHLLNQSLQAAWKRTWI